MILDYDFGVLSVSYEDGVDIVVEWGGEYIVDL